MLNNDNPRNKEQKRMNRLSAKYTCTTMYLYDYQVSYSQVLIKPQMSVPVSRQHQLTSKRSHFGLAKSLAKCTENPFFFFNAVHNTSDKSNYFSNSQSSKQPN